MARTSRTQTRRSAQLELTTNDVFERIEIMRAHGWKVDWKNFRSGTLGYGCVQLEVELDGAKGVAVCENIEVALERAIKRRARDLGSRK